MMPEILDALEGGRAAVTELISRTLRWKVSPVWYLISAFGLFASMLLAATLMHGVDPLSRFAETWPAFLIRMAIDLALAVVAIQLAEELAWTGFFQHRLQKRHGEVRAALIVAPLFGFVHLVVNYLGAGAILPALAMMGIQIVFALFFRVVVARLYNAAGQSVIIAALFHAALNVANDPPTAAIIGGTEVDWLPLPLVAIAALAIILAPGVRRHATRRPVAL